MKLLFAGASGTLAQALLPQLLEAGHEVVALTRSPAAAELLHRAGAHPVLADVLDRGGLLGALRGHRADAVLHELTALASAPTGYRSMHQTNVLRTTGTAHLMDAARELGAARFVTQSIVLGYGYRAHRGELDESAPFGEPDGTGADETLSALAENERVVLGAGDIEGVSLRYGLFYGRDAATVRRMLRRRMLPVTGSTGSVPFIHHEDAASATVAALERGEPGAAYNIADDDPGQSWRSYLDDAAEAFGVPHPVRWPVPVLRVAAPYAARLMVDLDLRVATSRAHRDLGWSPRHPSAKEGWRAVA